jgi:hypothetical protein
MFMMDGADGMAEKGGEGACVRYGVGGDMSARKTGSVGDGDRELGRGIWEGVGGFVESSVEVTSLLFGGRFDVTLVSTFGFARGEGFVFVGGGMSDSAGISTT